MKLFTLTTFRFDFLNDGKRLYYISHINPNYVKEVVESKDPNFTEIHFNDGSVRFTESPGYLVKAGLQDTSELDKHFVILN